MSAPESTHSFTDGLKDRWTIFWNSPGWYAETSDKAIVNIGKNKDNRPESSMHYGTAFWKNSLDDFDNK